MSASKAKLALYWAASCGGCEIAVLGLDEKILDVAEAFDIVFWPCVMDPKVRDIERMADNSIDVCLFNGGIRTSEQEYMARLMRAKSKVLVAFGSCALEGCIPGLANLHDRKEIFDTAYRDAPSVDNPDGVVPRTETEVPEGTLHLPVFYDTLKTLAQTVEVDYFLPGCPPEAERIWDAITAILEGNLPEPGSVIGADTTVCDECSRTRNEKKIKAFKRTWQVIPDPDTCLLEQGLVCCGIATRAGCGALCPQVHSPCIGCYGPTSGVQDFGARMMSALASVIDSEDPEEIDRIIRDGIPDPVGTFYRFGLADSLLRRGRPAAEGHPVMKRISIDPITRLEGHGKIDIFLDEQGDVSGAYLLVPELRGFERFCVGRPAEDMPNLTARICGVCPEAHHMASTKALDALFRVEPPDAAKKLRELLYSIFYTTDHTTHFYALGGPDFVVGPDAPPAERNILGVVKKVGKEIGLKVIKMRRDGHHLIKMIGGRPVHPNWGLPGGVSRGISEKQRKEIETLGREAIEFARFTLQVFDDIVLGNSDYVDLIKNDAFVHRTYNMGTVDDDSRVNFYDGMVRVVGPDGVEHARYDSRDYLEYVAEHVEPWSYLKFPYLKKVGWKGFVDGEDSGVYKATPLARLNAAEGMATPLAQQEYERLYETLGGKPVHHTLATHWARLVELLYAAERWVELATDPEITSKTYRVLPTETPEEGIGCVEAPRGTLTHHYRTDARGILTHVNLIVGTTNNNAPMNMSIAKAARGLIHKGVVVSEGLLNKVEMAFRAYDPCMACATHSFPGEMPLQVTIRDRQGKVLERLSRNLAAVD